MPNTEGATQRQELKGRIKRCLGLCELIDAYFIASLGMFGTAADRQLELLRDKLTGLTTLHDRQQISAELRHCLALLDEINALIRIDDDEILMPVGTALEYLAAELRRINDLI